MNISLLRALACVFALSLLAACGGGEDPASPAPTEEAAPPTEELAASEDVAAAPESEAEPATGGGGAECGIIEAGQLEELTEFELDEGTPDGNGGCTWAGTGD